MPQHLLDVRVPHVVFPQEALVGEAVHAQGRVDTIGADVAFVNVLACLMHQPPTGAGLGCVPAGIDDCGVTQYLGDRGQAIVIEPIGVDGRQLKFPERNNS